jgi:hypothetical protein
MLVHVPQTRNHKFSRAVNRHRPTRKFAGQTPLPDLSDLAIDYGQRHIALNSAVHNIDDIHMGYQEGRLGRQGGSKGDGYEYQSE